MNRACSPLLIMLAISLVTGTTRADIAWEDELTDETPITNNMVLSAGGSDLTFSTTVFSDSDGGTFDLTPVRSSSFFSFESGMSGNHSGYLEMTFDNENDDPSDYIELTINFGPAGVTNLAFSVLDLDGNSQFSWDDGIEVYYNGINTKTDSNLYSIGPIIFLDNESYMDGFEAGNTGASSTETTGNIDFNFGTEVVESLTIRYFSTDDAVDNPSSQFIGLSDLSFIAVAVPEPATTSLIVLMAMAGLARRRRN